MTKGSVLIIGARSDIAIAIAHQYAAEGYSLQLAVRQSVEMEKNQSDLELRYRIAVSIHEFDALATNTHEGFLDSLPELPVIAISAVGYMGDQNESEESIEATIRVLRSNFEGPVSIFTLLANRFESRGNGTLVGISSVAGERGRATNYVYGSAKAGFTAYLSGLRNRLASKGVHVVTVLPGFVATQMTENMDLPKRLTAQPEEVAKSIFHAVERNGNVIYVYSIWRLIMMIIRTIPEQFFKRLKL